VSYWANPPYVWGVSQVRANLGHVSVCEVASGKCLGMGCSVNGEM
jgi:hypothetical protein